MKASVSISCVINVVNFVVLSLSKVSFVVDLVVVTEGVSDFAVEIFSLTIEELELLELGSVIFGADVKIDSVVVLADFVDEKSVGNSAEVLDFVRVDGCELTRN